MNKLLVLNVYFPSTVSDLTTFMRCTLELEAILNRYCEEGTPVVIAGDFNPLNAHAVLEYLPRARRLKVHVYIDKLDKR